MGVSVLMLLLGCHGEPLMRADFVLEIGVKQQACGVRSSSASLGALAVSKYTVLAGRNFFILWRGKKTKNMYNNINNGRVLLIKVIILSEIKFSFIRIIDCLVDILQYYTF